MSLTKEAESVSGIPYVMDAFREEAEAVLSGTAQKAKRSRQLAKTKR